MRKMTEEEIKNHMNTLEESVDLNTQRVQSLKSMMAKYVFEKKKEGK